MAKKKQGRGATRSIDPPETLLPATTARRVRWLLEVLLWVFVVLSLVSFHPADPPSHEVAVHNAPTMNLCGRAGAVIAYGGYLVLGPAIWLLVLGWAAHLALGATGRVVGHVAVRAVGLLLMAVAAGGLQAILLPDVGLLVGARAGLASEALVAELRPRFNVAGTSLLLVAGFGIGALVAIEELLRAIPLAIGRLLVRVRDGSAEAIAALRRLTTRPERPAPAVAPDRRVAAAPPLGEDRVDEDGDPQRGAADDEDLDEAWEDEADAEYEYQDDADADEPITEPVVEAPVTGLTAEELRAKIARLPVRMGGRTKTVARDEDIPRGEEDVADPTYEGYRFPTLDLLEDPESNFSDEMERTVREQAERLEEALHVYGIDAEVVGIESGPTVTLYSVELAPGTKVAKVNAVSSDIARSLSAPNIRIVANMAGKTSIGIEVPNDTKETVRLKDLMSAGQSDGMQLPMFMGKDAAGEPLVIDLARMPHMLIAGTTGSGKSVCMNTIIMSWMYTKRPDELKLVLVDPKMVELSQFADIPHLMCPVVTEMGRAAAILEWAVNTMEERYELLKEARVRDIRSFNALEEDELREVLGIENDDEWIRTTKRLPYLVFVIDELADLMLTHREVEQSIVRIAQKARAVGIHLILATQRPQANVVTGLIKSNMPCRVSFKVASGMDSRIVLDQKGAELLLGQGDMMVLTPSSSEIDRAQGTFTSDKEIRKVARHLKDIAAPTFERALVAIRPKGEEVEGEDGDGLAPSERDPLFDEAVEVMIESGRGSVSLLQRRLAIGYSRASRLVDQMGLAGILGDHKGSVARDVLITLEDWKRMKAIEAAEAEEAELFEE